jgi:hypothetical protein
LAPDISMIRFIACVGETKANEGDGEEILIICVSARSIASRI